MIRAILATGFAAALLMLPVGAFAQQLTPGDGIETYSDTLPKHGSTAAKLVALKTSSGRSHKSGKSHKGGKSHGGKKKVKAG